MHSNVTSCQWDDDDDDDDEDDDDDDDDDGDDDDDDDGSQCPMSNWDIGPILIPQEHSE